MNSYTSRRKMKIQILMPLVLILFSGCKLKTTEYAYNMEDECWDVQTFEVPWFYWGPYIEHGSAMDSCEGNELIEYKPLSTCIQVSYSCGYRDLYNDPDVVPCEESNLSCCHPNSYSNHCDE